TIRERSGASTGSIYHFFGGKASLAAALLEEAVAGWSAAGPDALDPAGDAERSIRASVGGFVAWGTANPALFRFLDEIRTLAATDRELADLRERLEAGQQVARRRYENAARDGRVRGLPWPLAHSLMLGPA